MQAQKRNVRALTTWDDCIEPMTKKHNGETFELVGKRHLFLNFSQKTCMGRMSKRHFQQGVCMIPKGELSSKRVSFLYASKCKPLYPLGRPPQDHCELSEATVESIIETVNEVFRQDTVKERNSQERFKQGTAVECQMFDGTTEIHCVIVSCSSFNESNACVVVCKVIVNEEKQDTEEWFHLDIGSFFEADKRSLKCFVVGQEMQELLRLAVLRDLAAWKNSKKL